MRRFTVVGFVAVLLAGSICTAEAQLIDGPIGAVGGIFGGRRPVDPNRNSQSFDASIDLSGGYDRDPNAFLLGPELEQRELTRWYGSTGSAAARYRSGSIRRSINVRGRGYFNYQSNTADSLIGGEASVIGAARFGRRRTNQLSLQFQSSYEPGWIFGAFGSALGPGASDSTIGVAPPQGIIEQRWLVLSGSTSYQHQWNPRHLTAFQFENRRVRPIDGAGLDGDWQNAVLDQHWTARPGLTVIAGYRWDQNRQQEAGFDVQPIRYQTIDGGVRLERRSSPSRRYSISVRTGATLLRDSPTTSTLESVHPSFTATAEFATSRLWSMSTEFTQGVVVMGGVSPVPLLNRNVEVTFNGTPTRKLRYLLFGGFARADTVTLEPMLENVTDVAGVTTELRYALATWSAMFVSYGFYHHRIEDPSIVVSGFPPRYDRHSVRVGFSLWVPFYGAF